MSRLAGGGVCRRQGVRMSMDRRKIVAKLVPGFIYRTGQGAIVHVTDRRQTDSGVMLSTESVLRTGTFRRRNEVGGYSAAVAYTEEATRAEWDALRDAALKAAIERRRASKQTYQRR